MSAEAHVDDADVDRVRGVVVDDPLEGRDEPRVFTLAVRVEDLEGEQIDAGSDARHEIPVVSGGEDPGDVGPVAVVVERVGVAVEEVVAARVDTVELRVHHVGHVDRVVMDVVDAGIDDRDLDATAVDAGQVDGA